jgi:hypothetical protein
MHPEYAKAFGRVAYVWGWPMVNMMNRHATITQARDQMGCAGEVFLTSLA